MRKPLPPTWMCERSQVDWQRRSSSPCCNCMNRLGTCRPTTVSFIKLNSIFHNLPECPEENSWRSSDRWMWFGLPKKLKIYNFLLILHKLILIYIQYFKVLCFSSLFCSCRVFPKSYDISFSHAMLLFCLWLDIICYYKIMV